MFLQNVNDVWVSVRRLPYTLCDGRRTMCTTAVVQFVWRPSNNHE